MGRQAKRPSGATLCADGHKALKGDDKCWEQAAFAGYQPLGRLLGEYRMCPRAAPPCIVPCRL
jgi:hypothetical protein